MHQLIIKTDSIDKNSSYINKNTQKKTPRKKQITGLKTIEAEKSNKWISFTHAGTETEIQSNFSLKVDTIYIFILEQKIK